MMSRWNRADIGKAAPDVAGHSPVSHRWLHVTLFAIALVGWTTFILACVEGPAWSPDSSKILFGYFDSGGGRYAVALYDLSKHKTRILFERPTTEKEDDDDFALLTAWQKDGERALILTTEGSSESSKHCTLLSLFLNSKDVPRTYDLGNAKDCWHRGMVLLQGDRLYLAGDNGVSWTNLVTGETGSSEIKGGSGFLHEHNRQVVYMRGASRPLAGAKDKDTQEDGIEFGQIELASAALKPAFTIWQTQFTDIKLGDSMSAAWEPDGSRLAMIGAGEETDKILMMDQDKGPAGVLVPQLGAGPVHLGNLLWSRDGKTLYAAAITSGSKEKTCNFSLAEIPVSGAPGRLTAIAPFTCEGGSANDTSRKSDMILPLALSPDGNWMAATPSNCDTDQFAAPDRALFLIDLRRQDRHITRVLFPNADRQGSQTTVKVQ